MNLQSRLTSIRDAFDGRPDIPGDVRTALDSHIHRLVNGGAADRALQVGDRAPETSLVGPTGEMRLAELVARGPVVLTWIRGDW